jgi:hypothetical protein
LANAVLAEHQAALALQVLTGGPHELKRARELAELVREPASVETVPTKRPPRRRK